MNLEPHNTFYKRLYTILAALFLIAGIYGFGNAIIFVSRAQVTDGTVIEHVQERTGTKPSDTYSVIEFKNNEGKTIKHTSTVSSVAIHPIGKVVKVYYLNDKIKINSFLDMWLWPTLNILIGLFILSRARKVSRFSK